MPSDKHISNSGSSELGEWDGEQETYAKANRKIQAFKSKNKKKFRGYFNALDPRVRGRITKSYTVREPDSDDEEDEGDPTGARPGTRVYRESKGDFRSMP